MKPVTLLVGVIGTFLLVVSQHGAYANNRFLAFLGIERGVEQDDRNLILNLETRARIHNTRLRRREDRRAVAAAEATKETYAEADRAQKIATTAEILDIEAGTNTIDQEDLDSREEEVDPLAALLAVEADTSESTGGKQGKKHAKKRQKEERFEKRLKKKEQKAAAAMQSESAAMTNNNNKKKKKVQALALTDPVSGRADKMATVETISFEEGPVPVETPATENTQKKNRKNAEKRQKEEHYEKKAEKKAAAMESDSEAVPNNQKNNKNNKNNKKAKAASDRTDAATASVETVETGGASVPVENNAKQTKEHAKQRQKEELYEKKVKNKEEKLAWEEMTPKEKEAERRYEKKADNRAAHKTAQAQAQATDRNEKAKTNILYPIDVTESSEITRIGTNLNEKDNKKKINNKKKGKDNLTAKQVNMNTKSAETQSNKKKGKVEHANVVKYTSDTVEISSRNGQGDITSVLNVAVPSSSNNENVDESSHERLAHERQIENHYEKKVQNHLAKKASQTTEVVTTNHKNKEHAKTRQDGRNREKRIELREKHSLAETDRTDPYIPEDSIPFIPFIPDAFETIESSKAMPAVALYWGVFNNPKACSQLLCTLSDVSNPETEASILHGTGAIPDRDGNVILVSSLYRTPKGVELADSDPVDDRTNETSGVLPSPGFYNTDAAIVVAIRIAPPAETGTMAQMLRLTETINVQDNLTDFVQYASFQPDEIGFGELFDFQTGQIVRGNALVHLTRQNDVVQVYLDTNVSN